MYSRLSIVLCPTKKQALGSGSNGLNFPKIHLLWKHFSGRWSVARQDVWKQEVGWFILSFWFIFCRYHFLIYLSICPQAVTKLVAILWPLWGDTLVRSIHGYAPCRESTVPFCSSFIPFFCLFVFFFLPSFFFFFVSFPFFCLSVIVFFVSFRPSFIFWFVPFCLFVSTCQSKGC